MYVERKPFSLAKPAYFDFFSSNFTVQDHISTLLEMLIEPKKTNKRIFETQR
jgi:hypothetical protein